MTDPKFDPMLSNPTSPTAPTLTAFVDAYDAYKDLIAAVSDDAILHINVDVPAVVTMICGAWPEIVAMRGELSRLPHFDATMFDQLEGLALALNHTQALYVIASTPAGMLPALAMDGVKARDLLLDEVKLLGKRGLVDAAFTQAFRNGQGYKTITAELHALVTCLRTLSPVAATRSRVTPEELAEADAIARSITQELGLREQAPIVTAAVSRMRSQAFTLVAKAWDQIRRGVMYLRWNEGDGDEIAPSIYAGRGGRRSAETEVVVGGPTPPDEDVPQTPRTGNGGTAPTPSTPRIEPGMPGSSPFRTT